MIFSNRLKCLIHYIMILSINLPSILTPDFGLIFWMLLAFLVVFFIVAKFGFPVITNMVEERKKYIDESLQKAKEANERLAGIEKECENIIKEAHQRQAEILKQAKLTGDQFINEAREKAAIESNKIIANAKEQIEAEKQKALNDINQTLADVSVVIAEKIIRQKLDKTDEQQKLIERMLDEVYKA